MSALAITLLGLSAWLAERGSRSARRSTLERRLPRALVTPPRTGRAIPAWAAWWGIGTAAGFALAGLVPAIVAGAAGIVASIVRDRRRRHARVVERDEQLVDAVGSIVAAIRAGRSLPQALAFAADEARPPLRDTLRRLDGALDLGVPVDDALATWVCEVDTDDARLVAGVLTLHRRSGGDLPAVLDQVAATLRERRAAVREVRALTAQARLSGTILGVLPFGFFAFLWLTSRSEIEAALRMPAGAVAVGLGLALEGLAFLWIRHLLEVR